jgi:chromosome segregation ATPase
MTRRFPFRPPPRTADDPAHEIHEEDAKREERVSVLRQRIREFDDEYETNRERHESRMDTLARRADALSRQIALLSESDPFVPSGQSDLVSDKAVLESQLAELRTSLGLIENALNATEKECSDLRHLLWAIPSANEEIVQIARRQISRKIQSEIFEVQFRADDLSEAVVELQADVQLSKVVATGLRQENGDARERIDRLSVQLANYKEERAALMGSLQAAVGQIPMSELAGQLRDFAKHIEREVKEVEAEYAPRMVLYDAEIPRLTGELDHSRDTVEELNIQIQKLSSTAMQARDAGAQEVDKVRRRNRAELDDIVARHRVVLEQAIADQQRNFIAQGPLG